MDLNAYHQAWLSGATESEAVKAGEDAYEREHFDRISYESQMAAQYEDWVNNHPDNPNNKESE